MSIASLSTERLLLRPFELSDAPAFHALVSDPRVLRYTGESAVGDIEGAREVLRTRPLADYRAHGFGRMACIERESGRLIGFSGLKYLADLEAVDIGYRFVPEAWGRGYATESARPLVRQGFEVLGLERIIGLVMAQNLASARVLVKLGLLHDGQVRVPECPDPLDRYALTADRFRAGCPAPD
ncbi:MAG: GNAT family N-acetyltransferase [Xanthomonadales bacterium]|nr:GNAT family N-acetyltransferase [Xanthomonadales bacterium]